jgi:hypothetical protein
VLYALLTGQPPHPGVTPDEQLAHARRGDVIPPRALQPSIPRALQRIVLAALAADPARRYASAAELRQALRRYRHRPMYAAAVAGLVALLVVVAQALAWPRPWSSPPAPPVAPPPPQAPLWVERMELEHSRDGGTTILGTIGVSDTSACRSEDAVRIKARLTAPAYCYLIALHPNGSTELYHPGDEAVPPPLSNRLSYPLDNHLSPLTDGVGLQAFVLVASREPLPPYAQWKARLGDLPWGATQAEGVWHYDGQQFEPRSRRRSEPRPAAVVVPAPFEAACRALRQVPGIEAIDAWAFPILPKESASPDPAPDQTPGGP